MMELGAMILASMICMLALIANGIRIDNEYIKQKEQLKKNQKWNWN